jgi:hypothetical protein
MRLAVVVCVACTILVALAATLRVDARVKGACRAWHDLHSGRAAIEEYGEPKPARACVSHCAWSSPGSR